jgi:hypothetical protein
MGTYFTISGIKPNMRIVKLIIEFKIHVPNTIIAPSTTTSFGTNVRVISCIEVVAWKMLTVSPTMTASPSIGADIIKI